MPDNSPTASAAVATADRGCCMLQAYSVGVDVSAGGIIPFNNVIVDKGCAENLTGVGTIELEKAGMYLVLVNGTASASTTIQLVRNGVALPQAQATGTSLAFSTFIQVPNNNCNCNCKTSPVTLQVSNETAATFPNVNIVVKKVA